MGHILYGVGCGPYIAWCGPYGVGHILYGVGCGPYIIWCRVWAIYYMV